MFLLTRGPFYFYFFFQGNRGVGRGDYSTAASKSTRGRGGRGGRGRASPAKKPLVTSVPIPNPGSTSKRSRPGTIQNAFSRQSQRAQPSQRSNQSVFYDSDSD